MSSSRRTCCNNNRVGGIIPFLNLIIAAACFFTHCDAGRSSLHDVSGGPGDSFIIQHMKKMRMTKHFDWASLLLQRETLDSPQNTGPYVGSPFTLPPYTSLPPISIPDNSPPYCLYPPNTPQAPSTTVPFPPIGGEFPSPPPPISSLPPLFPNPSPPPGPPVEGGAPAPPVEGGSPAPLVYVPGPPVEGGAPAPPVEGGSPAPPVYVPGPPVEGGAPAPPVEGGSPAPPVYVPGPPSGPTLSPPYSYTPSPPAGYVPSPTGFVPSPPTVFLPPIVYPRHATPPPPRLTPTTNLWCVAKPAVPDPILEEAMNYACGSGADCESIQPSGPCFSPNTYLAHASYAFNSYWQRTKVAGGTCSFGGTAMLVTVDPSYDGCHFLFS